MNFAPSTDADVRTRFDMAYGGGPPSTAGLVSIAAEVNSAFGTHLAAMLSSSDALTETECVDLANPGTPAGVSPGPVDGSRSGTQVPLGVTALVNFTPARRYRGGKPKIFAPFGTDADVNNPDSWTSTFTAAMDAAWAAFIGELVGVTVGGVTLGSQVYVSYFSGKEDNPNPNSRLRFTPTPRVTPVIYDIVSHATSQIFGSQRRRYRA